MLTPRDSEASSVTPERESEIWIPALPRPELPLGLPPVGSEVLPALTHDDLRRIRAEGWARVGVVAAIIRESDGHILMLKHKKSIEIGKTKEGAMGVMSETSRATPQYVESTLDTLHRAVQSELSVEDPIELELKAYATSPWMYTSWVVGGNHEGQHALAVSTGLIVTRERSKRINPFINSKEIQHGQFYPPERAMNLDNLRPGIGHWIETMQANGMLNPDRPHHELDFTLTKPMGDDEDDHLDVRFDRTDI